MADFQIGDKVNWTSSNVLKVGEVAAIVPAGKRPGDVGHPKAGGGGNARDHQTYVVRGQTVHNGVVQPTKAWYWPRVSLLTKRG